MNPTRLSRRTLAGALVSAILLLVAAAAAFNAPPAAALVGDCTPGSDWGTARSDLASSVVNLINQHRTGMGLVALQVSPSLTNAAMWKARHMARYAYLQHDDPAPPIARTVADRLEACGYPSRASGWGENIAYGYSTAQSVVDAWLNSAGHKANIENSSYRSTGVGAAATSSGVIYWSQEFGTATSSGSTGGTSGGTTAPTVTLTSGPASSTTSTGASFAWTSTGTVSATTCSLDNGTAVACASPRTYSGLAAGTHSFRVTVSNSGGSASATYSWTIASSAPAPAPSGPRVSLTSGPSRYTFSTAVSFAWTTTGTVTKTTCTIDTATPVACSSPWRVSGLRPGNHRFIVTVQGPTGTATAGTAWYEFG
jgi:uncharacterized protein YkwD